MKIPVTRFYQVQVPRRSEWARIWITDDGCITTISDHGNYGYWFGAPGCEFRRFLVGCGDDYLINKFSSGEEELDQEATTLQMKRLICEQRRARELTKRDAREEWELVNGTDWSCPFEVTDWFKETRLGDAAKFERGLVYRQPMQVQMFVKVLWPLFVEQLKTELAAETAAAAALEVAL